MAWFIPAAVAAASIGNTILGGKSQERQQKRASRQANRAVARMELPNILKYRREIMADNAPFMEAVAQANQLAGLAGAQRAQAGMSRMGLGNTGLGASMGAGLQAGASFQTNQLRARMQNEALQQAYGVAQGQANALMGGVPAAGMGTGMGAWERGIQGAGSMLTALAPYYSGGGAPSSNPVMANIGGKQQSIADWYRG